MSVATTSKTEVEEAKIWYNGDVSTFSRHLGEVILEKGDSKNFEGQDRGLLLAALGCNISGPHANYIKSRPYDLNAEALYRDMPHHPDEINIRTKIDHVTQWRRTQSGMGGGPPAEVKEKRKRGNLRSQAEILASRMLGRPRAGQSILGFLASGSSNPLFCTAVCRKLMGKLNEAKLGQDLGSISDARSVMGSVIAWAKTPVDTVIGGDDVADEEASKIREDEKKELRSLRGRSSAEALSLLGGDDDETVRVTGLAAALFNIRPLASRCQAGHVCPFCLASQWLGVPIPTVPLGDVSDRVKEGGINEINARLGIGNLNTALQIIAKIHNKEMHALNGNINFMTREEEARTLVCARASEGALGGVKVSERRTADNEQILREMAEFLPTCNIVRHQTGGLKTAFVPSSSHTLALSLREIVTNGLTTPPATTSITREEGEIEAGGENIQESAKKKEK